MDLAPWRTHLAGALHRNRSLIYARYLQLATVRSDGTPANRTVVFRGFAEGDRLQIISDRRSAKIQEMSENHHAEACWYFPKTREQFRLGGHLQAVSEAGEDEALQQLRSHLWQTISEKRPLRVRLARTWGRSRSPRSLPSLPPQSPHPPRDIHPPPPRTHPCRLAKTAR